MVAFMATLLGVFVSDAATIPAMAQEPVDLELVLAADGSGSIDDEELRLQREGYARAVRNPRVLELLTSPQLIKRQTISNNRGQEQEVRSGMI